MQLRKVGQTACIYGKNEAQLKSKVEERTNGRLSVEELQRRGRIVGTGNQIVDLLGEFETVGMDRIMLQWIDLDDLDGLNQLATEVLGQL